MSAEVESKVLEMRFDNKQFEANVQTSLNTIEKLKRSLNLTGATKGLENVASAAKNCNMSGMSTAVETIQAKFSGLEVMAVTALANITNSAVNAGKKMVSALTIDPIKTGFNEYETKINSIQTIMSNTASKGTTMEDVTRVIGELNTYADKTIYNFAEMTRNIGTFTAAGVGLEESAAAIQGIANLAAASGSSSQQASTAMYQLSQALAAGTVKLMDWNSVVNAGMGGEKFQEALKATARDHGIAVDDMIKKNGSFRESLQEGWITADILNETLNKFTVDGAKKYAQSMIESGKWTQEQADALVKEAQAMEDAATKVKTFTQLWDTLKESAQSGWSQTWEIIVGDFEEAKEMFSNVSKVLGDMIGASADARNEVLQGWSDLGGRTVLIEALSNAFEAIMSVVKPIKEAFSEIFPPATAQQLMNFTERLRDLTANLILSGPAAESLKNVFKGLFSIVQIGVKVISGLVQGAITLIDAILPVGGGILSVSGSIGEFISKINEALSGTNIFATVFGTLGSIISPVATAIGNALKGISDGVDNLGGIIGVIEKVVSGIQFVFSKIKSVVSSAMDSLGFDSLVDAVNSGLFAGILLGINKFIKSLTNITSNGPRIIGGIRDILDGVSGSLQDILDGVSGSLQAFQSQLKAGALLKIASAIAILAGSLVVLSMIDEGKLTSSLGAITGLFIELFGSMTIFEKIAGGSGFKSMGKVSRAMIGISTAVLILSAAMKNLASLSWDEIGRGLTATVAGLGTLIGAIYLLPKDTTTKTGSLIGLSTALVILSGALKVMGSMSWDEIGRGLTTLAGSLAILIGSMHLMKSAVAGAASMLIISSALVVLSGALKIMGTMSWDEIGRGLTVLAGSLAILVGSMHLMTSALAGAASMLVISSALLVLSGALKVMATLSWEEIGKCMTTMAGSLLIMAGATALMTSALPGAAAILVISGALAILTPALLALSTMSWEGIAKGLVAMAGAFGVIGVAGLLLGPISPMILALGAAVALLGVGCLAAGAGLLAFSTALAALAVSGTAGAAALVTVVEGIIGMIPSLAAAIGMGIVAMAAAIGAGAGAIMTAVTQILNAILQAIIDVAPKIAETVTVILTEILGVIADITPKIVDTFVTCLSAVLDGIVEFVPKMVEAGLQIMTGFLQGIADNIGGVVEAGVNIITEFLTALGNELPRIVDAGFQMMISFINGLADSISTNTPVLTAAIGNLMNAVITAAVTLITCSIGNFLSAGANVFGGFINGLKSKVSSIISTVSSMISQVVSNIKSKVSSFVSAGGEVINGFIQGIRNKISGVVEAAKEIGSKALNTIKSFLGIASPSRAFIAIGKYIGEGLAQGITDSAYVSVNAMKTTANSLKQIAKKSLDDVKKWVEDAKFFNEISVEEEIELWRMVSAKYKEGTKERLESEKNLYTAYKTLYKENYDDFKSWINDKIYYNEFTINDQLWAWKQAQAMYKEGTDERKEADKQVYKLENELRKDGFNNSMDWIDQEKYYNRLSLEEELAAYERVQARYKWGSEEWLKMEREKYRVRNEIVDASYQHSMDWIDQEKYYNRLSLYDELAAYKRVQSRYEQGTDEYKKMAREIYRVQNEINDANENFYKESIRIQEDYQDQKLALEEEYEARVKEINERLEADIKAANDAYDDALESRTKSLYDAYSLWDKVEPKETVDGADLFTNLQSQVDAFEDWQKDINELAGKGINAKLLEELQEMGPSSAAEIKALNKLSTHELNDYVELWQEKYNMAKEQATFELEDMRQDTKNQIKQLRADAKIELDEYTEMWNKQMADLKDDMNDQLDDLRDDWMDTIGTLRKETKSEFTTMTEEITNIIGEKNSWSELGSNIVEGVLLGIVQKSPVLTEGVVDTMTAALEAAKETLGIQSPSKAFAELGMYSDKGFAVGLMQYASVVSSSATQVGKEAVSSLSNSISRISSMVTDGMDAEPTIRPVLDLSNIQNGVKSVNGMFNPNRTLSLGLSLGSTIQPQAGNDSFKSLKDTTIAANDKVVSAIDSLKEDVSTLADAIRNIKLVMDTGALVGAISPEMDRSLGQIAAYNKRGI